MQIHREKFLALTATLAGFFPGAACTIKLDGLSVSATLDLTTTTDGTTDTTTEGGGTSSTTDPTTEGSASQGTTGASTTGPTTGSTTAPTSGTTGTADADCCLPHATPGCNDATIQACVCAQDDFCCGAERGTWDATCVNEVNQFGCGMCELDTGGPDTTTEGTGGSSGTTGSTGGGSDGSGTTG